MGLFRKKSKEPERAALAATEVAALRADLADIRARLKTAEQAKASFESRLDVLDAAATSLGIERSLPPPPPDADVHVATIARLDELSSQLGLLAERLSASDSTLRSIADQVGTLDQRVTAVSVELANQIDELGRDIDALSEAGPAGVDDAALESLRTAQVRLANEQARYEIAFRADLATLAEQLRRGRT
ncbi:MAG: hypothetical protein ACKOA2_10175 [Ilumatobacteraceae bacterium]